MIDRAKAIEAAQGVLDQQGVGHNRVWTQRVVDAIIDTAATDHRCCVTCGAIIPTGFAALHNRWHDRPDPVRIAAQGLIVAMRPYFGMAVPLKGEEDAFDAAESEVLRASDALRAALKGDGR